MQYVVSARVPFLGLRYFAGFDPPPMVDSGHFGERWAPNADGAQRFAGSAAQLAKTWFPHEWEIKIELA